MREPLLRTFVDASSRFLCRVRGEAPAAANDVERIAPPSAAEFRSRYLRAGRPVVFRGLATKWHGSLALDDLSKRYGHRRVAVTTTTRHGKVDVDPHEGVPYRWMTLAEYIERLSGTEHPGLYLATPLEQFLPGLLKELGVPSYCDGARWRRSRLWIGAPGTVAPLHRDMADNLFAQLVGRKRFWLYHRRATPWLYAHSFLSALPNHSRFDPERADDPRYAHAADVARCEVVLEPGDVLYLPSMWWHHVRGLDLSVSVNHWWAEGWLEVPVRAAEVFKNLRGLKL